MPQRRSLQYREHDPPILLYLRLSSRGPGPCVISPERLPVLFQADEVAEWPIATAKFCAALPFAGLQAVGVVHGSDSIPYLLGEFRERLHRIDEADPFFSSLRHELLHCLSCGHGSIQFTVRARFVCSNSDQVL